MVLKLWNEPEHVKIFAIVEISKRTQKIGVVMTSVTSRRALIPALNRMIISAHPSRSFEIWEFSKAAAQPTAPREPPKEERL